MARQASAIRAQRERDIENLVIKHKTEGLKEPAKAEIEGDLFDRFYKVSLKIAHQYKNNPIDVEDMAVIGMEHFKVALDKYDPAHEGKATFLNFASTRIKFGILDAVREHYGITTNAQKHLFSHEAKYRREVMEKHKGLGEGDTDILVAKRIFATAQAKDGSSMAGINSLEDALEHLKAYKTLMANARQINAAHSGISARDEDGAPLLERIEDKEALPVEALIQMSEEAAGIRTILTQAFAKLDAREKIVFVGRLPKYGEGPNSTPRTLESLSEEIGVSRERIRQIFVRAHEKVQKQVILGARNSGLAQIAGLNFSVMDMPEQNGKKSPLKQQRHAKRNAGEGVSVPEFENV